MSTLNDEQKVALQESIKHWERMRDDKCVDGEASDSEGCACCEYANGLVEDDEGWGLNVCVGCPIYEYTGETDCIATPYYQARNIQNYHSGYSVGYKEDAQRMIDFMQNILDTSTAQ